MHDSAEEEVAASPRPDGRACDGGRVIPSPPGAVEVAVGGGGRGWAEEWEMGGAEEEEEGIEQEQLEKDKRKEADGPGQEEGGVCSAAASDGHAPAAQSTLASNPEREVLETSSHPSCTTLRTHVRTHAQPHTITHTHATSWS